MTVSSKRLIIDETLFQDEIILVIDAKTHSTRTLLEIFNAKKISINQSCGGFGTCGTCRVEILSGHRSVNAKSDYEIEQSIELNLKDNQRLSCQTELNWENADDVIIKIVGETI